MKKFQIKRVAVLSLAKHYEEYQRWHAFEAEWERPNDFPRLDALLDEIEAWCVDQFGDSGTRFIMIGLIYLFRDEIDATAFRLRWC